MSVELDDLDLFHRPQECSFHSIVNEVRAPRPVDLCHTVLTDTIYGAIALPGPVALLYDTPQVQRLQDLKQLGAANFVFPTATHTRLAHSVGVAYLGMDLLRRLREAVTLNPLTLCVNPWTEDASFIKDLCCVGMAGLCHDLGHGPFSHLFESFINEGVAREKRWSHEENSLAMLRAAWELRKDDLMDMAFDESDLKFVSLLIRGMEESEEWDEELYGRPETCRFMTEIVANKLNGLDVDKIDYIQRDAFYCLNTTPIASVSFLFTGAIIAMVKGRTRICYPSSVADNVEQIFFERASLHRLIYQCRDTLIVNHMVKDALHRANDHVRLSTNPPCNFTTCVQFPDVFLTVSDWVLGGIHRDGSAENATAREIVGRIYRRDFYRTLICYTRRKNAQNLDVGEMEAAIRAADAQLEEELQEWSRTHQLSYLTIVSQVITIGSSDTPAGVDPVSSVAFHDFGALDDNVVKVGRPHALDGSILAHHVDHKTFFIACRPSLPVEKLNVMIGALLSMQGMERAASQSPVSHKRERSTTNVAMSPAPSQPRLDDHHSMEGRRSFSASPSLNVYRGL